ncbi:glutaredoxin 3 [Thioclava sp. L04-15]|uniref:glutaredoxin 3 n=1 Tax=Thioclava sp. L04-15 TaxID=1915318 RepID=UPI000996E336|nr:MULTISPECIES: glutaredoxin 3 [unclassified Thioclava]MBD3801771.1 glutaredoxin 3 [Thioclava sp.]OOY29702.1 glutaredoxin 3 [Thioclava sp. L04-15]TNE89728.1 MAG: glutaredoxin 3 [Paracoccaceae bacterium]
MKRVEIYVTRTCPFCIMAKRLLDKKGVAYEETDVGAQPQLRAEMMQRANGRRTVPQIFIGGESIGGCDELHALEHAGKLDAMLAG